MGRRRQGQPPEYLLHKATGQAYATLAGKPYYFGEHGTPDSWRRFEEFLASWRKALAEAPPTAPSHVTVRAVVKLFTHQAKKKYTHDDGSPTGEAAKFVTDLQPVLEGWADRHPDEFRATQLKQVRAQWLAKGMSRKTINQKVGRVVRVWRWALSEELIDPGTLTSLESVAGLTEAEASDPAAIPAVEEKAFRAAVRFLPRRLRAMAWLQWLTGMRPGEACRVRGADLNLEGRASVERKTLTLPGVWVYQPYRHKNKRKRGVSRYLCYVLGPKAQSLLRPWLRDDPEAYLFSPAESMAELAAARRAERKTPLPKKEKPARTAPPRKRPGRYYAVTSYDHAVHKACVLAGVEPWSPNQIRHAWVTRVEAAEGIERTSKAIGHTSVNTTLIYLERRLREAAEVASKHG